MSGQKLKIFIVGHTGLTGKALIKHLSEDSRFEEVVLIGRRNVELNCENSSKFSQEIVDFDNLDAHKSVFTNYEAGICCLGTTRGKAGKDGFIKVDYDYTKKVAELAKEGGCNQFHLVSSTGANANSSFLYPQIKGKVEKEITDLSFSNLFIYRPKMLMGNREETRFAEGFARFMLKPIAYMSPTLMTTPIETLAKSISNTLYECFTTNSNKGDANSPVAKIIYNTEIFDQAKIA